MILQKLITYLTFPLLYTTDNTLKEKYIIIFKKTLNIPFSLNKTKTLKYLNELKKDLEVYLKENIKNLTRKERVFIKALLNFILQLSRYLKIQDAKQFPTIIDNLQDKELLLGIEQLSKNRKISKKITLLDKPFIFDYKVLQPSRQGKNPFKK